jgi:hypothetical protein
MEARTAACPRCPRRAVREVLDGAATLADSRGFRGHELTELRQIVTENKEFFQESWHDYFGGKN